MRIDPHQEDKNAVREREEKLNRLKEKAAIIFCFVSVFFFLVKIMFL